MLRKGYTTGVALSFAFRSALDTFVRLDRDCFSVIRKIPNDDIDVTKNIKIIARVYKKKPKVKKQKPFIYKLLTIYAGRGVGIVTKKGLSVDVGYGAINPTPIKVLFDIYKKYGKEKRVFLVVEVENGKKIAKKTANEKVGVIGGISILGKTGFVKPISTEAYLQSIKTEIDVIKANSNKIALSVGNNSFSEAKKIFKEKEIVEIGNFIYDSLYYAKGLDITLFIGVAKGTKVALGFKNTNNKYGSIDFKKFFDVFGYKTRDVNTIREFVNSLNIYEKKKFYVKLENKIKKQINSWHNININIKII